jgi:hypothetical protein
LRGQAFNPESPLRQIVAIKDAESTDVTGC